MNNCASNLHYFLSIGEFILLAAIYTFHVQYKPTGKNQGQSKTARQWTIMSIYGLMMSGDLLCLNEVFCLQVTHERPIQTFGLSIEPQFHAQPGTVSTQKKQNQRPILLCLNIFCQPNFAKCKNIQQFLVPRIVKSFHVQPQQNVWFCVTCRQNTSNQIIFSLNYILLLGFSLALYQSHPLPPMANFLAPLRRTDVIVLL